MDAACVLGLVLFLLIAGLAALVWLSRVQRRRDARCRAGLARTIEMESDAFEDEDDMGSAFTCRGAGVSPPLRWNHLPHGTRSLALVVTDPDAPAPGLRLFTIVHWVLYDVPPGIEGLPADASPCALRELGLSVGRNWSGDRAYARRVENRLGLLPMSLGIVACSFTPRFQASASISHTLDIQRAAPVPPHQTVREVFPHTAFRYSSSDSFRNRPIPLYCSTEVVEPFLPKVDARPTLPPPSTRLPVLLAQEQT